MSPDLIQLFVTDGRKFTDRLQESLTSGAEPPDADSVRRAARRLQHSALLASQDAVVQAASALQKVAVELLAGRREWSTELGGELRSVVSQIRALVDRLPDRDPGAETELHEVAVRLAGGAPAADQADAEPDEGSAGGVETDRADEASAEDDADAELEALISELEDAVDRLENDPRDREPLKSILRRIRKLRDLGRIEVLSPPDKALNAVEELILQIADLNATVGPGYLTVFRHAREVLEGMRAATESGGSATVAGNRAVEVDELKDRVMETARRARQVTWVSELFFEEGPHITACPLAEREAGSAERYFLAEARQRLDRSESLRKQMLESDTEQMRLAGESLAHTLRHLRERAVAFNHAGLGRVTRRAAAALRAQLVRPPSRLRSMATGFGSVFSALDAYLESEIESERERAVADAESALHAAILGDEPSLAIQTTEFDPDRALQHALALRTRIDEKLSSLSGPEARGLREELEQLFDLIAYYVSVSATRH